MENESRNRTAGQEKPCKKETKGPVVLEAYQLHKRYCRGGGKTVEAVNGLSIQIRAGECRGIVGESGCGKSTLIRMLAGLEKPDSGEIRCHGKPLIHQVRTNRNQIQMIFQNSMDAVNRYADAEAIIGEPLKHFFHQNPAQRAGNAAVLMEQVGLSAEDLHKFPGQFSGGQLQRICIARALAAQPEILLLDEPLSSLDVSVQAQIMELFKRLGREYGLTQVLVSHDMEAVYYLSDSISVMYGGMLMEEIHRIQLFEKLCHPYTRRLLDACRGGEGLAERKWAWDEERMLEEKAFRGKKRAERDKLSAGCPYAYLCPAADSVCRSQLPAWREIEKGHYVRCGKIF